MWQSALVRLRPMGNGHKAARYVGAPRPPPEPTSLQNQLLFESGTSSVTDGFETIVRTLLKGLEVDAMGNVLGDSGRAPSASISRPVLIDSSGVKRERPALMRSCWNYV